MTDENGGEMTWSESMSARDRVRAVAKTVSEPRSTQWISEQASVGWGTADSELTKLTRRGDLERVEREGTTWYVPNRTQILFEVIELLVAENTKAELRAELVAIAEEIEDWQASYGVESREDLERTLSDPEQTSAAIRERNDVLQSWQENDETRDLIRYALVLYDAIEETKTLSETSSDKL